MNETETEVSYSTPWVRSGVDNNGKQLWRLATDGEIAEAKALGVPVHRLHLNGESN